MVIPISNQKDENFQKKSFVLSGFVRMKIPLTKQVYEFCDFIISKRYQFDLAFLHTVDKQIIEEFNKYKEFY